MTNYEKIKSLTVHEMACLNVKQHIYTSGYRPVVDFYTTDQTILIQEKKLRNMKENGYLVKLMKIFSLCYCLRKVMTNEI